ncbi:MAG: hypothetical protein HY301_07015 [Verrucomicrobia bacterium]|nr:hypothetical protein [Verrucomicrobiota bacterium]
MSTLQTVDLASGSEDLIDATLADLESDLIKPVVRVYVYVGTKDDPGWDAALTASGWLVDVKPYLASDISLLRKWVGVGDPKGIVFRKGDKPCILLDATEAAAEKTVRTAIANAKEAP